MAAAEKNAASPFSAHVLLRPWDDSLHAPFVVLINPRSGGKMGAPILEVLKRNDYYKDRSFNILDVVKGGDAMNSFRACLNEAKTLASVKAKPSFRPRLICGGGDGTASFALLLVFRALLAQSQAGGAHAGQSFSWSDQEMEQYFPALVQMPLGTGNDLGRALGWGSKYPGHSANPLCTAAGHGHLLAAWFDLALRISTPLVNFDIWGFMPPSGTDLMDVKVCELAAEKCPANGGREQCYMKPADVVVPFLVVLYSSFGLAAHVVAKFQLSRHNTQLENLVEYGRIGLPLVCGRQPSQLPHNLEGLSVVHTEEDAREWKQELYFPPRKSSKARAYSDVGFLNINSYSGGVLGGKDRAPLLARCCGATRKSPSFCDGQVDFFRMRSGKTLLKSGRRLQTDKRHGGTFKFEAAKGQGIFLQYDGEGRFVFHPEGKALRMDVKRVLTIPVVVAPSKAPKDAGGEPIKFSIIGSPAEADQVKHRILRWVRGELVAEMNATASEILAAGLPMLEKDELAAEAALVREVVAPQEGRNPRESKVSERSTIDV